MMHFIAFHNEVYLFRILRSSQILSFKRQTEDASQRLPLHDAAMNAHRELSRWLIRQDPSKGSCAAKDAEDQLPVHAVCTRQWLQQHSEADHLAFLDMILPLYPSAAQMSFDYAAGAKVELEQCKAADRAPPDLRFNFALHLFYDVNGSNVSNSGSHLESFKRGELGRAWTS